MNLSILAMLCGSLLCAQLPAQSTSTPASGGTAQPQQDQATPQSQPAPSTPQTQQPTQPSMTPPNAPQNSGAPQTAGAPSATAAAQSASTSATTVHRVAPGSVIPVELAKSVDAKKAKTGDEVVATVTQDMKSGKGDVVIPKDTQVIGHVTESRARSKEQRESELGIAFDHAVVKGDQMQMPMSIQAVIGQQTNDSNNQASNDQGGGSAAMPGGGAPTASSAPSSPMGGRSGSQAPTAAPPTPNAPDAGTTDASQPQQQAKARPAINGMTQGVIGISNLKLQSNAQNTAQGSLLTSDKNNVKIDKGTMLLLRVNP